MEGKKEIDMEQEVSFKVASDLTTFAIKSEDTDETLFEITGYGLNVNLNRDKIKSLEDVEGLLEGITSLYRKVILKELLPDTEKENS